VLTLLRDAVDQFDQTVVMVTHDADAAAIGDRIVVLRDGKICHDAPAGTTGDVHELMKTAH
jgi:putative ABC transport system ATP-binding protein